MKTRKNIFNAFFGIALACLTALAFVCNLVQIPAVFAETAQTSGSEASAADEYVAEDFQSVPSDWELISNCDAGNTRTSFHNGEMFIHHNNNSGTASKYYGSAYKIATGNEYGDFTFEMTFRATDWVSVSRFFAVMFHTRTVNNRLIGYMVNYRISGQNAISALNGTPAASDNNNTNSVALSDKALHTLKLELSGTTARYYIDGLPITIATDVRPENGSQYEWDVSTKDTHLEQSLESGGFALLVNQSMISIKSVKIKPYVETETEIPVAEEKVDNTVVGTYYDMDGGLVNGPTVVSDVRNAAVLESLTGEVRPSNAILTYKNGNVVGSDGASLGSFAQVYEKLRGLVIPVVRIETEDDADSFIEFMTEELNILDISVMSSDPAIVRKVRLACPATRGIIYFGSFNTLAEVVAVTNSNRASTVVLPQELCTVYNVTYIQARFKTVWAATESNLSADIYDCINSGAYGVVSPYFNDVYDVLSTYPENSVPRAAMNVAHRGACNLAYENSLSAVKLAVANGATHLELDGILTKDSRIAISHDDSIAAITDGTGSISNMTLAQVQSYNLTVRDTTKDEYLKDEDGNDIYESIPSLEQVLEEIRGTEVVLVFEIKTDNTAIIPVLENLIRTYGMASQVVVITFDTYGTMLPLMYERLPEIPVALLEGLTAPQWSVNDFAQILTRLGADNATLDKSYQHGGASLQLNRYLRDRGIAGWYWTFADEAAVTVGESLGYIGITNNCTEIYNERVRFVSGADGTAQSLSVGDKVAVEITAYGGETYTAEGEVFYCRRTTGGWQVIARYLTDRGYMYTQRFEVVKI